MIRAFLIFLSLGFICPVSGADLHAHTLAGTGEAGFSPDGTPAREARLNQPFGVTRGPDGLVYFTEVGNHLVRCIDASGKLKTIAGTGQVGYAGDGGVATKAQLNEPYEIRFSPSGEIFFVEMKNHLVRQVDKAGNISTVLGGVQPGFQGDYGEKKGEGDGGPSTRFRQPHAIQFDPKGLLYVCDIGNHRVRTWDPARGELRTFAGNGQPRTSLSGGDFSQMSFHGPRALDFDSSGTLWLALREGNAIYRLGPGQKAERMAGTGKPGYRDGAALEALLSGPKGLSVAPDGDVFFADTESHTIRQWRARDQTVQTVVGDGQKGNGPDGPARQTRLARPHGVFVDRKGLLIGDSDNHKVRFVPFPSSPR